MNIEYREMSPILSLEEFLEKEELKLVIYTRTNKGGSINSICKLETIQGHRITGDQALEVIVGGISEDEIINNMARKISHQKLTCGQRHLIVPSLEFKTKEWPYYAPAGENYFH